VYVRLKAGAEGNAQGAFQLVVETVDGEEAPYQYTIPVPALAANEERVAAAYALPGTETADFSVRLQNAEGRGLQTVSRITRNTLREVVKPQDVLFLSVGSRLPGLTRTLLELDQAQQARDPNQPEGEESGRTAGFIDSVALMPDRWFGYAAADVIVLATGNKAFVEQLLEESEKPRRDALREWVRRGGRLVLSVGQNHQAVARLLGPEKMPLLNCDINGSGQRAILPRVSVWSGRQFHQKHLGPIEVARLAPGADSRVLVREAGEGGAGEGQPVLVESASGLGRVVLVAFDLDTPPFTTWDGQPAFWKQLQAEVAPTPRAARNNPQAALNTPGTELAGEFKRSLEMFEEVPVISFGWVALFILFYIILVGPLDYFVLKKVFKRLEFTWITFPTIVLVVSLAAYFTAYSLKGDDLRVNKVDLVEIDLHGPQQAYGTTWFALFSPRIQNYTVGVEPAPTWVTAPAGAGPGTVVSVMESPEPLIHTGSQSLFRRPYRYAPDAAGIERVPIPVWAARTFSATWQTPWAGKPPVEATGVARSQLNPHVLKGVLVNHLPAELRDAVLFCDGKWYSLGTLPPEGRFAVEALFEQNVRGRELPQWFQAGAAADSSSQRLYDNIIKPLLFYKTSNDPRPNSGLRSYDQSWRLRPQEGIGGQRETYRDEAILVARTRPLADRAEQVTRDGVSASRLWLNHLPGTVAERPALHGTINQETFVRVYIPVRPAKP
jgi:hypothetical protein